MVVQGEEIVTCEQAGIAVTCRSRWRCGAKAEGRFGEQDFVYPPEEDAYPLPGRRTLRYYFTNVEKWALVTPLGRTLARACPIKAGATTAEQRRITHWEHEHVLEAVQRRLDENLAAMRHRRKPSSILSAP
jgi:hypothetical protein